MEPIAIRCEHAKVGADFTCLDCGEEVCYCVRCDRTIYVWDAHDGPIGMSVLCADSFNWWRRGNERTIAEDRPEEEQLYSELVFGCRGKGMVKCGQGEGITYRHPALPQRTTGANAMTNQECPTNDAAKEMGNGAETAMRDDARPVGGMSGANGDIDKVKADSAR